MLNLLGCCRVGGWMERLKRWTRKQEGGWGLMATTKDNEDDMTVCTSEYVNW